MLPILSHNLMASSIEPGLLGEGGSAMPVRALVPVLDSAPAAADPEAAPTLPPPAPAPATATVAIAV